MWLIRRGEIQTFAIMQKGWPPVHDRRLNQIKFGQHSCISNKKARSGKAYISLKSYLIRNFAIGDFARDQRTGFSPNIRRRLRLIYALPEEYRIFVWDSIRCRTRKNTEMQVKSFNVLTRVATTQPLCRKRRKRVKIHVKLNTCIFNCKIARIRFLHVHAG